MKLKILLKDTLQAKYYYQSKSIFFVYNYFELDKNNGLYEKVCASFWYNFHIKLRAMEVHQLVVLLRKVVCEDYF